MFKYVVLLLKKDGTQQRHLFAGRTDLIANDKAEEFAALAVEQPGVVKAVVEAL